MANTASLQYGLYFDTTVVIDQSEENSTIEKREEIEEEKHDFFVILGTNNFNFEIMTPAPKTCSMLTRNFIPDVS